MLLEALVSGKPESAVAAFDFLLFNRASSLVSTVIASPTAIVRLRVEALKK